MSRMARLSITAFFILAVSHSWIVHGQGTNQTLTSANQNQTNVIQIQTGETQNQTNTNKSQSGANQSQNGANQNQTNVIQIQTGETQNQTNTNKSQSGANQNQADANQSQNGANQNLTDANQNQTIRDEIDDNRGYFTLGLHIPPSQSDVRYQTNLQTTPVMVPGTDVCGKLGAEVRKIVGGSEADLGQFPWMTALGYTDTEGRGVFWLCAGSLVTEMHVITAGHCLVVSNYKLVVARLGELDLDDAVKDDATPTDYEVLSWTAHPGYRPNEKKDNDIGIVKLRNKVTYTKLIQPICLPTLDEFSTKDFTGYSPYVAGWGNIRYNGFGSTSLLQVQVEVTNHGECQKAYSGKPKAVIDDRVICAGIEGKDSCQGDSGAPLMMPRGRKGTFYLFGVVSYGRKCGTSTPGVYTRVNKFLEWIQSNLK